MYASGGEMSRRSIAKFNTNPISSHRPVANPIQYIDKFTLKEKNPVPTLFFWKALGTENKA